MASFLGKSSLPRGIRNNNPGNIKRGSSAWKGKIPFVQSTDTTFEQFTTVEYGIRAMYVLLRNYYKNNGLNTVKKIIQKYAPAGSENPHQTNYINHVVKGMPMIQTANDKLNLEDEYQLKHLAYAMAQFENGISQTDGTLGRTVFDDAYKLFNGNTTISEMATGVESPQGSKIKSILTIIAVVGLTYYAIKS